MKFGRLILPLVVLGFGLITGGCSPRDQGAPPENGAAREVPAMEGREGVAERAELQMEMVAEAVDGGMSFLLTVTNVAGESLEVIFPSGQTYDFEVRQGAGPVWRWSEEYMFTQAMRTERLEPGESWTFEETWQAPAEATGEFEVVGRLVSSNHPLEQVARFRLP